MRRHNRTLAGLGLGKGNGETLGKRLQGRTGARITHPAAADDQRCALALEQRHGVAEHGVGGWPAVKTMHAFLQEIVWVVIGLGLHILGQGQGHRTGFGRIGKYAHGLDRRAHQLFGTVDPVPIFAHCLERIVGTDTQVVELLDLLQHRVGLAAGIDIPRQQQQRDAIGGGRGRCRQHVRRPRTDRRCAGIDPTPQVLLGETDGGMTHALLIAALMHHQFAAVLLKRLAQAQDIAVAENAENPGDELALHPVHLDILVIEEFHQGLGHRQSCRAHAATVRVR